MTTHTPPPRPGPGEAGRPAAPPCHHTQPPTNSKIIPNRPAPPRTTVDPGLHAGGVFALWSDDPPDHAFGALLAEVFPSTAARVITFANPLTGGTSANTVYIAS